MSSISKSELTCNICKLVLSTSPVNLPCSSVICGEHLRDGTVKNGMLQCQECDKNFNVPRGGFPSNEKVVDILTSEVHLSDDEKEIKRVIQELVQKLEQLQNVVKLKQNDMEVTRFDYFAEIRRHIDIQREELKKKIDEIALKLIDQANEKEKAFTLKLKESISVVVDADINKIDQLLTREFRNPVLIVDQVRSSLQVELERNVKEFAASISDFEAVSQEMKSLAFTPIQEFGEIDFGVYRSKSSLIAVCVYDKINILEIKSGKCVTTLKGHSDSIRCLEKIDENRFASGCADKTIKIWDAHNFVCLKTIVTEDEAWSLKSLTQDRLASGCNNEIHIWNLESGQCLQKLKTHGDLIYGLDYLPISGNLVSFSQEDDTIKVWDLGRGECKQTINTHSEVRCLVLLRNGQLASCSEGSKDINIWNMESGECVKTLVGHTSWVNKLQQLENDELVSCSSDETIKFWNLTEGTCIRTLYDHNDSVLSIKADIQSNTLISFGYLDIVKIRKLKSGECIKTIIVDFEENQHELIFI